jgi:glyoxylase-like metal-dependent hydrolase (beta-lactamase superfamily II)
MEITSGLHRLGDGIVNVYLVEESAQVTIVDAGVPSYWNGLPAALARMGRSLADVRAVLLTHGHSDHIGFAERARREASVPVMVHESDAALARGEVPNPAKGLGPMRLLPMFRFLAWSLRHGALRMKNVAEVSTFGDGATLDVPGSPRVIHVPGHTPGSAALHFVGHEALLAGDALCTLDVMTGERGPRVAPFTADRGQALQSLARLEGIDARYMLPGHGEPWSDGIDDAVRHARGAAGSVGSA